MKHLLFAGILIFFVLAVFASAPEIDYTDAGQVNTLPPADLFTAIHNGELTNLAVLSDSKLTELITYNDPEEAIDGSELFMEIDSPLFAEVDERARGDVSFLNRRPQVLDLWFQKFDIQTSGPMYLPLISSYDGKMVVTDGQNPENSFRSPTKFHIQDLSRYLKENNFKARVLETGALIIEDMSIYQKEGVPKGGPIELRLQGNMLEVQRGIVDINLKSLGYAVSVKLTAGSLLSVDEYQYQSPQEFFLTTTGNGIYTVTGKHIRITQDVDEWQAVFSGHLEHQVNPAHEEIEFLLGGGSKFTEYSREERDHNEEFVPLYTVSTQKKLSLRKESCSQNENCLFLSSLYPGEPQRKLTLTVIDNNLVEVKLSSGLLRFIEVNPISDGSAVHVLQGKQGVRISQNGRLDSLGASDLRLLPEIKAFREGQEFTLVKRGQISGCNLGICEGIVSAKSAGRRGKLVHIAAARLDGQQATMTAARKNGLNYVGYEATSLGYQNVQEDLATAQVIALSGHHIVSDDDLWGESGTISINNDLPDSESVEAVTFSACNTIKDPEEFPHDPILSTLSQKYPNLQVVSGYNTKAPLSDGQVWAQLTPMVQRALDTNNFNEIKRFVSQPQTGIVGVGTEGSQKLGLYLREKGQWKFCYAGGGCKDIAPMVAAVASGEGEEG